MRFILNFFFFGFVFYMIYLFFPEAFHTLASWAQSFFDFLKEAYSWIIDKITHTTVSTPAPVTK